MNTLEELVDIDNYIGLYQVSNLGNIRSLNRLDANGRVRYGCMMSQKTERNGYMRATLSKDCKKRLFSTHRLVAIAFVPNPNNLPEVNHRDENKSNNNASNLEWSTTRANQNYSANKKAASKYAGVDFIRRSGKWRARCSVDGKSVALGVFEDELEAAQAYVDFCKENKLTYKI